MKKTERSRPPSVRASGKRNSSVVPSEQSAERKSKKSKHLTVATPQNTRLQYLKNEGLIAPNEIDPASDSIPLDFTRLNGRQVGSVHSRYAVRHAHAIFVAAKRASMLTMLRRDLRLVQAKYRFKNNNKFKTKYELDDAMQLEDDISELLSDITKLEAELEVITAVALGYEDYRNAASREIFRRSSEVAPKD